MWDVLLGAALGLAHGVSGLRVVEWGSAVVGRRLTGWGALVLGGSLGAVLFCLYLLAFVPVGALAADRRRYTLAWGVTFLISLSWVRLRARRRPGARRSGAA